MTSPNAAVSLAKSFVQREGWRVANTIEVRSTTQEVQVKHACRDLVEQAALEGIAVGYRLITRDIVDAEASELRLTRGALERSDRSTTPGGCLDGCVVQSLEGRFHELRPSLKQGQIAI